MASKSETTSPKESDATTRAFAGLQNTGVNDMMDMNTVWMEALSDISAEVASFVADRIQEDVKTQHEMLHCKDIAELRHIQATFIQKVVDQYQAETGKLVEMSTAALAKGFKGDT